MRFYHDSPRIDFETELNDVADRTVVVAEFPFAAPVTEVRRGVPYGFTHSAWPEPTETLPGFNKGITPAVRWSHYAFDTGGLALFDRGLSGRELDGRTALLFLLNATDKYYGYPNSWLSGQGRHRLEYSLYAHEGPFAAARVPHHAWEYNAPPYAGSGGPAKPISFLETSGNVIVESMRRDGGFLEIRCAECFGQAGEAWVRVNLTHGGATLTDLCGNRAEALPGGPRYQFPVRPQQIVTIRCQTSSSVPQPEPLLAWDPLVPAAKRPALHEYSDKKGHPPRGE
jgi:alpha-mannosidase